MPLVVTIDPWVIVYVLLYLIVGLIIVAVHQSRVDDKDRFDLVGCLVWTFFWAPMTALWVFFNIMR